MAVQKYPDANLSIAERVSALVGEMTLDEKIGQMTQVEKNSIPPQDVGKYFIGSVLSGGGGYPQPNTPAAWFDMVNSYQEYALNTRLAIPILYGVDAVHGHACMNGATVFPHNVGLGATRNAELVRHIARATAEELAAVGIFWNFAPTVAIPQDIRWGRTYEGFGENAELVARLGSAYVRGSQGEQLDAPSSVLATAKHYMGDGGTSWKTSQTWNFLLDQGDTRLDEPALRKIHLPPYISAVQSGVMCVMPSYSSWNGLKMTAHKYLLTDVLKGELGFEGFLVTDWNAVPQLSPDYFQAVVLAVNAGMDMVMVPYDYKQFISTLRDAVQRGDVTERRIDDAVSRILRVKMLLGISGRPSVHPTSFSEVGATEHHSLARRAVRESLVLLKNDAHTLPLSRDIRTVLVAGKGAHNLGMQCGGWTIEWMGIDGNMIPGTTILQGIKNKLLAHTQVIYTQSAELSGAEAEALSSSPVDIGIVVVGEAPYAEGVGDREDLGLSADDIALIEWVRSKCHKLIAILICGRPMIITDQLPLMDACVCAWLPGQEGEGIADVLFGDHPFTGRLPYTWPRRMAQLPFDFQHLGEGDQAPLFTYGFGLPTKSA